MRGTATARLRAAGESGFTLVEVLVVVLIIGLLAAIALPTFLGQKDKAKDAVAKAGVRSAVTQMESCLVDAGFAECSAKPEVTREGVLVAGASATGYELTKLSRSAAATDFNIAKTPSGNARSCGVLVSAGRGSAGCPATGSW